MEHTPNAEPLVTTPAAPPLVPAGTITSTDWRKVLPVLASGGVSVRELRLSDAGSLMVLLTTEEVTRFISPPPSTKDGFERFIHWTQQERSRGNYVCFGIVPDNSDFAVGLIQIRQVEPGFATAEWGFALGQPYWGSGLFEQCARMVAEFAFTTIGVHRLEARAAVQNARGNGALRKLGATQEGILRKSFLRDGEHLDQNLWTLLADDWAVLGRPPGHQVH
jgi:[ribosomal protein S5]-alanine N-acetyltransferase